MHQIHTVTLAHIAFMYQLTYAYPFEGVTWQPLIKSWANQIQAQQQKPHSIHHQVLLQWFQLSLFAIKHRLLQLTVLRFVHQQTDQQPQSTGSYTEPQ